MTIVAQPVTFEYYLRPSESRVLHIFVPFILTTMAVYAFSFMMTIKTILLGGLPQTCSLWIKLNPKLMFAHDVSCVMSIDLRPWLILIPRRPIKGLDGTPHRRNNAPVRHIIYYHWLVRIQPPWLCGAYSYLVRWLPLIRPLILQRTQLLHIPFLS